MKLALVFDDLIQFGGAEKLLLGVCEIWPEAPVYTSMASREWRAICKAKHIKLNLSFMQHLPAIERLNKSYFFFYPLAFSQFDFSDYDVVVSISARFAHGIITKPTTLHICYMNSPGRMFWEPSDYFENFGLKKEHLSSFLSCLRLWDYSAAQKVDYFVANSKTPQARIQKYYGRDSKVIYPFVEIPKVSDMIQSDYFLVISRLVPWKNIDIVIEACGRAGLPLKVLGMGPDFKRLFSLAKNFADIELLGYVSDDVKWSLLSSCKAVIHPQFEDFGIVPLEAMALGKPVIAYAGGGALETVLPGKTGVFFDAQTPESLLKVLRNFNSDRYDSDECALRTHSFSKTAFKKNLKRFVENKFMGV